LLKEGEAVGCGDSVTLEESKVFEFLRNGNYNFLDKHRPGLNSAQKREIYLQNFRADTFISGVNAITQDGGLYFVYIARQFEKDRIKVIFIEGDYGY